MSRPIKQGLDYFPMDVNTDDKFELIEAKHGLIGFAIVVKLYQKIYKDGYYIDWNEEKLLLFKKNINVDINIINDVINDCLEYNIFNKDIFKNHKILTSSGIQKRYLSACERRKTVDLIKNIIIVNINEINVNINWINDINSTQSKVKQSKALIYISQKEFYEAEIIASQNDVHYKKFVDFLFETNDLKKPLSAFLSIPEQVSFEQFTKLMEKYNSNGGSKKLSDMILAMENDKKYTKGKKSAYLTLNNWVTQRFIKQ